MTYAATRSGLTRIGLSASAAIALIAGAAVVPAAAQSKTYPAGTDCSQLVGNAKDECARQSWNTASPDNANNPDNADINTSNMPPVSGNTSNTYNNTYNSGTEPADSAYTSSSEDCTHMVGNTKDECAQDAVRAGSPDNSNNPDAQH